MTLVAAATGALNTSVSFRIRVSSTFVRVTFKNCKLIGSTFIDSFIKNTEFTNVSARYVNMAGAKINNMKISNSDFSESSFVETKIKNLDLSEVKFTKAEFLKTLLNGVDFSSSDITDVMFDVMSVKGMIINEFQCIDLIHLLGVMVK